MVQNLRSHFLWRAHEEETHQTGGFWSIFFDRPKVTFLSAIIPNQTRPSNPKSENLFGTPPGSVPPLIWASLWSVKMVSWVPDHCKSYPGNQKLTNIQHVWSIEPRRFYVSNTWKFDLKQLRSTLWLRLFTFTFANSTNYSHWDSAFWLKLHSHSKKKLLYAFLLRKLNTYS